MRTRELSTDELLEHTALERLSVRSRALRNTFWKFEFFLEILNFNRRERDTFIAMKDLVLRGENIGKLTNFTLNRRKSREIRAK